MKTIKSKRVCTTSQRQRRFWQIMVTSVPMAWVGSPPNDEGSQLATALDGRRCRIGACPVWLRSPAPSPALPHPSVESFLEDWLDWGACVSGVQFPSSQPAPPTNVQRTPQTPCRPQVHDLSSGPSCQPAGPWASEIYRAGSPSPELPERSLFGASHTPNLRVALTLPSNSPSKLSATFHLMASFCTIV